MSGVSDTIKEEKPQVNEITIEKSSNNREGKKFDVDKFIGQLLSVQTKKPGTHVDLDLYQIHLCVDECLQIIKS